MKKHISGFISGVLVTLLITTMIVPSFAASIEAAFNSVNIALNNSRIAEIGEGYTLDNGTEVPYSILYEGTTYLPMRKIGELVGMDVDWDASTRTAMLGDKTPDTPELESDPKSITQYVECNAVKIGDSVYELPLNSISGANIDEKGQIYIREHYMRDLNRCIAYIMGDYEISAAKNPLSDGRIKATKGNYVEEKTEKVYISASEIKEDYRVLYNNKVLVSPQSPHYNDETDNLGVRKIFAYGSASPKGWWFNLNDVLSYFGVEGSVLLDVGKNLLIIG